MALTKGSKQGREFMEQKGRITAISVSKNKGNKKQNTPIAILKKAFGIGVMPMRVLKDRSVFLQRNQ